MNREDILGILKESGALLEGHFLLSSGKHSNRYVQCAQVLRYPHYAELVLRNVVKQLKDLEIDLLVGPAMGGVIVSYEMGRQLNKESIFVERKDKQLKIRRGFEIRNEDRVLITEDVITTGKSVLETKNLIERAGANVIGVSCIVDRTGGKVDLGIPIYSAVQLIISSFEATDCPYCTKGTPLVKPGSRNIA